MSQSNFVVQDVVSHVYRKSDYGAHRVVLHTVRNLLRKMWLFIVVVALSAGIGYVAVYLPETMARKADNATLGGFDTGDLQSKFDNLSDEQKKELMKQFGGQR